MMALVMIFNIASLQAVEVAPRISDREIIESLAEIKAGQQAMQQRFEAIDQRFNDMEKRSEQRFNDMEKRSEQRFTAMEKQNDQRFTSIDHRFTAMEKQNDQRFNSIDQRFSSLESTINTLFSALIMLIVALFGYIAWDRRTALKPLERDMQILKQELENDLELKAAEGSIVNRMASVLKELAQSDPKVAQALRNYSLL